MTLLGTEVANRIEGNIKQVIVGKDEIVRLAVIAHRLLMRPQASLSGIGPDKVVAAALRAVEIPLG